MIYCIDIDETLCHSVEDDYAHSVPNKAAIEKVNKLFDEGHQIKLFTGRGSWDNYDWREFTEKQLQQWGIKYHELLMGKPHADIFIDDKAINASDWLAETTPDTVKEVQRDWGKEIWLVNCDEYCGKLLFIPKGAKSGDHYHKLKKETFYCLRGQVQVVLEGRDHILNPLSAPITIRQEQVHSFSGISNGLLLEISTHHNEEDVVFISKGHMIEFSSQHAERDVFRLSESKAGKKPPIDCRKFDDCPKVMMVLDKDLLDFQYREAIKEICHKCTEREPL